MQADAEQQQNHPYFGKLFRNVRVRDKARRVRADDDAGQDIADQRGQAQFCGDKAADEGHADTGGDCRDKREFVKD